MHRTGTMHNNNQNQLNLEQPQIYRLIRSDLVQNCKNSNFRIIDHKIHGVWESTKQNPSDIAI